MGKLKLSIAEALQYTNNLRRVSDSARLDCEILLAKALQRDRVYLYTWPERTLTDNQRKQFFRYLKQREQGVPVAYITGEKDFWSLTLQVNNSTLIPRPETELLVETALHIFCHDSPQQMRQVIDLGTGSGAIALALASEKPCWQVIGVDISPDACDLAEKNRLTSGLVNVTIQHSYWLDQVEGKHFDMIISNPPYIDADDPHLMQGDVRFEPVSALVAEKHGLADIETIAWQAIGALCSGGWLLFEHGYQQGEQVRVILREVGFDDCRTVQDVAGHDRVTLGRVL